MTSKKLTSKEIDFRIAVLDAVMPKNIVLTLKEIADVVGCRHQVISQTEKRAIEKLKRNPLAKKLMQEIKT